MYVWPPMVRGTGCTFAMGSPFGGGGLYLKATDELSPNQHLVSERPCHCHNQIDWLTYWQDSLLITNFIKTELLVRQPNNKKFIANGLIHALGLSLYPYSMAPGKSPPQVSTQCLYGIPAIRRFRLLKSVGSHPYSQTSLWWIVNKLLKASTACT